LSDKVHDGKKEERFMRRLIGSQGGPLFTVFVRPQAGKAFEVLIKGHSISLLLKCVLYFLNQGSGFEPASLIFFIGEVFFLLTQPLMGAPLVLL
jgi:hypothetical protein